MLLAIKVDVDTFRGARDGVPRLVELFGGLGGRASFFFSYGPDNAGKAIWNCLRTRGYLGKLLRTRALDLYGVRTALSGTLLPAPVIADRCQASLARVRDDGHEVGAHAWDHRLWQDRLPSLSREALGGEIDRAFAAHEKIFGEPPRSFAAPGWTVDDRVLAELEQRDLAYSSSTRFGEPFYPIVDGSPLRTVELPSTEFCPEEFLNLRRSEPFPELESVLEKTVAIYPAHAEVEGGRFLEPFRSWLGELLDRGATCVTLGELARDLAADRDATLPVRRVTAAHIPGRPLPVATGFPERVGELAARL